MTKAPKPLRALGAICGLVLIFELATAFGWSNANAQSESVEGQHWTNTGITLQASAGVKPKNIKLGPALNFRQSTVGQNLLHGVQFVVSPGRAAQRERMNLYSLEDLGKIWPDVRAVLEETDVKATLVTPSSPNQYVGVPVKWNSAFATTMSGAFWGSELDPSSDVATAVASALIADGIVSGQGLSLNEGSSNLKVAITGSEPSDAWLGLNQSLKNFGVTVPKKGDQTRTAYVGFDVDLEKTFSKYRQLHPDFATQAPTAVTQIISTRELDGSRLSGWHKWVTE
ncbi:MAG: hypothetical protein ABJM29_13380 [Rhizobiaceae bacterium]